MWIVASGDPVRVVVEQTSGGWFSTWGTVIGVAVGAVLGAVAQILAGAVQGRRDRKREMRVLRRDAYLGYATAVRASHAATIKSGFNLNVRPQDVERYEISLDEEAEAWERSKDAATMVEVYGSRPVIAVARRLQGAVDNARNHLEHDDPERDDARARYTAAHDDYVRLVRSELEVEGA